MNTYTFSPTLQKSFSLFLLEKLDSYFFFGGTRTQILVITPTNIRLAAKKRGCKVSTIEKIIKILSFILLPLVIIAFILRYFLHKKFDKQFLCIPKVISNEDEALLGSRPQAVEKAVREISPAFFSIPRKYQLIRIDTPRDDAPSILFPIGIEIILKDLCIDTLKQSNLFLKREMDFLDHPEEKALFDSICSIEKDQESMSLESKKLLITHFLKYLFVSGIEQLNPGFNPENGRGVFFRNKYSKDPFSSARSIWANPFFGTHHEGNIKIKGMGYQIFTRLKKLGISFSSYNSINPNPYFFDEGCFVYWESQFKSALQDHGILQKQTETFYRNT